MAAISSWSDLDDSHSFTGSFLSASSDSTVMGPGATAGRFLKAVGELSLDLVVGMIIRRHLGAIEGILEKKPKVFRNPTGDKEWKRMIRAYNDLEELSRESRSEYYPLSLQRAAAHLIKEITLTTRPIPGGSSIGVSPTNYKWEALLERVQRHEELLSSVKVTVTSSRRYSTSSQSGVSDPPKEDYEHMRKVLVVGGGGVGKSTFVKQFRANLNNTLTEGDIESYREIIVENVVHSMENILSNVDPLQLSTDARRAFTQFFNYYPDTSSAMKDPITTLWQSPVVRRAANRAKLGLLPEFVLEVPESLFDSAHRILEEDYRPTPEDLIHCRVRTVGVWEDQIRIKNSVWRVIDTGGEICERKKWKYCFDDVTAIIFVVALSDYNLNLAEDWEQNRINDSLALFKGLLESQRFSNTLIILLFNKIDVFKEKLKSVPLHDHFPDYTGTSFDGACQYFEGLFLAGHRNRRLVIKYICAVDTEATFDTLQSIKDDISKNEQNVDSHKHVRTVEDVWNSSSDVAIDKRI